jgi:23S rRNA pseudouridine1911/1915/1917 synthase
MAKIPFYANHEDNMHCAVACYRMLFEHFMHRVLTWEEAEKMAGHENGKAAWTVTIWQRMSRQGFDIRMIEDFDYRQYMKAGDKYLQEYFTQEEYDWQLARTDIKEITPNIPAFLKEVKPESRKPTLDDIDDMLDDGRLVFLTLNSHKLNGKDGYASHAVLVTSREGDNYIVHDPGNPPQPGRRVSRDLIWEAMGAEKSTSEATGVKLKLVPTRADVILSRRHPEYSRAALAKLFDMGLVYLGDKQLKTGDKIHPLSELTADMSPLTPSSTDIDLPILYEDDDCVVVNKPAGVLTHVQGIFSPEATVASFLRSRTKEIEGSRAGIVHRLDRPTSGVIIGAKNPRAMSFLQKQFADRSVRKTYIAIVAGELKEPEAIIDMPIERNPKAPATFRVGPNGKSAVTRYKVLQANTKYSLVELKPQTGRTHQLRVHMAHIGHPIVGDSVYAGAKHGDRLYLHAHSLTLQIPDGEEKTFTAPLPPEFEEFMAK